MAENMRTAGACPSSAVSMKLQSRLVMASLPALSPEMRRRFAAQPPAMAARISPGVPSIVSFSSSATRKDML